MASLVLAADSLLATDFPDWTLGVEALAQHSDTRIFIPPWLSPPSIAAIERRLTEIGVPDSKRWNDATMQGSAPGKGEAPCLVGFAPWGNETAIEAFARKWPGPVAFAIDWERPGHVTDLERFRRAEVDFVLSNRWPDELPPVPGDLLGFFVGHWTWLPPCVRVLEGPIATTRRVGVLAFGRTDFRTVPNTPDATCPTAWDEFRHALDGIEGFGDAALSSFDFSQDVSRSLLGCSGWLVAPENPQVLFVLEELAASLSIALHNVGSAYVSPSRHPLRGTARLPPARDRAKSLRDLISPGFRLLSEAVPNAPRSAADIASAWTPGSFIATLHARLDARLVESGPHSLDWLSPAPAWRVIPDLPEDSRIRRGSVRPLQQAIANAAPALPGLEELNTLVTLLFDTPLNALSPDERTASLLASLASSSCPGDKAGAGALLRPILAWALGRPTTGATHGRSDGNGGEWTPWVVQIAERLAPATRLSVSDLEARALLRQERAEDALTRAQAAHQSATAPSRSSDLPHALLALVDVHFHRGNFAEAKSILARHARHLEAGALRRMIWHVARESWGRFLASPRTPEAARRVCSAAADCLRLEVDSAPSSPETLWLITGFTLAAGEPDAAIAWLDEHAASMRRARASFLDVAYMLWMKSESARALACIERAGDTVREGPENLALFAGLQAVIGNHEASHGAYGKLSVDHAGFFSITQPIGAFNKWLVLAAACRAFCDEPRADALIARARAVGNDPFLAERLQFLESVSPTIPRMSMPPLPDFPLGTESKS